MILARVLSLTREGWLESYPGDDELVPYWRHRHELTVEAGCVAWSQSSGPGQFAGHSTAGTTRGTYRGLQDEVIS